MTPVACNLQEEVIKEYSDQPVETPLALHQRNLILKHLKTFMSKIFQCRTYSARILTIKRREKQKRKEILLPAKAEN